MPYNGEERYLYRWEDKAAGRPWEIGLWVAGFPVEMDTMAEPLPTGLIATPGISYNKDPKQSYLLTLYSTPQWRMPLITVPFSQVYINGDGCRNDAGVLGPQGYPQVLLHREFAEDALMLKILHGNTNNNLTRLYTWIYAVERLHRYNGTRWDVV